MIEMYYLMHDKTIVIMLCVRVDFLRRKNSFNYICANLALNKLDYQVTKYNCALSDTEGEVDYYIRDPNDGGGNGITKLDYDVQKKTQSIKVPAKTLDSFNLDNISFIKIDVE